MMRQTSPLGPLPPIVPPTIVDIGPLLQAVQSLEAALQLHSANVNARLDKIEQALADTSGRDHGEAPPGGCAEKGEALKVDVAASKPLVADADPLLTALPCMVPEQALPQRGPETTASLCEEEVDEEEPALGEVEAEKEPFEEYEEPSTVNSRLEKVVKSKKFELVWVGVVLLNALSLAIQVEMNAQNPSPHVPSVFTLLGVVFAFAFMVEIGFRYAVHRDCRWFFYRSPEWAWNLFDTIVVVLCSLDAVFQVIAYEADIPDMQSLTKTRIFRMVRVLRLVRAIRILKVVRNVGPLRSLVKSMFHTLQHLLWALILIMLVIFVLGLIYTDAVSTWIVDELQPQGLAPRDVDPNLIFFSSGLHFTMQTLWWAISNGINYTDAVTALVHLDGGWAWANVFDLYVAFMMLGALNVLTGVVCERAMDCTDKENQYELALRAISTGDAKVALKRIRKAMKAYEANPAAAFDVLIKDPWVMNLMSSIQCHMQEMGNGLFNELFDRDHNGQVDVDEFVLGCLKLKWPAKALDMAAVKMDILRLHQSFDEFRYSLGPLVKTGSFPLTAG